MKIILINAAVPHPLPGFKIKLTMRRIREYSKKESKENRIGIYVDDVQL